MKRTWKIILWTTAVLIIISLTTLIALPLSIINRMTDRHVHFAKEWESSQFGLDACHFFVYTPDNLRISAYEVPVKKPKAVIICLSGIHGPSATIFFPHARLFKEHRYATIIFDMRAHGESDGDKIYVGYKEYFDTRAIVEYVLRKKEYENVPIVIMGVSMGASTAINSIGEIPAINGLISLSAYSSWEENFVDNMALQAPRELAEMELPFVKLISYFKFGKESRQIKPINEIQKLGGRPALLMHSREDSQVPFSNFERLMRVAPSQVVTFVREGDKHFITDHFDDPARDSVYSKTLIDFLKEHF